MRPLPIVVLVSGSGSLLQALIEASADPSYGAQIVAVGADREATLGQQRAITAGIDTFVCRVADFGSRADWDRALADEISRRGPAVVVSAGFMKIVGPQVLSGPPIINTHPALLPSFPGAYAVRDALAYGVKITGTTCHRVDSGMDTGPIITQHAVEILADDDEASLHERIKVREREMLVNVIRELAHGRLRLPELRR